MFSRQEQKKIWNGKREAAFWAAQVQKATVKRIRREEEKKEQQSRHEASLLKKTQGRK